MYVCLRLVNLVTFAFCYSSFLKIGCSEEGHGPVLNNSIFSGKTTRAAALHLQNIADFAKNKPGYGLYYEACFKPGNTMGYYITYLFIHVEVIYLFRIYQSKFF